MKLRVQAVIWMACWALAAGAQQAAPAAGKPVKKPAAAVIRSVRVVREAEGPSVEVVSSGPIVPTIQKLDSPPRLVIDVPNSRLGALRKRIDFRSDSIAGVRVDQYQADPPIARVVVDLARPTGFHWDATGNKLTVRLRPEPSAPEAPTVSALRPGTQPAAVPVSPGSSGAVVLAGNRIGAGSSVTAGADTALLHLSRGGEVKVCPGTTVSVTPSQNGRDLMLGMSTGALEAHYKLEASADSVLTPDFRILLAGPGEFHYAVSVDAKGNTCVRGLPGNTGSAIVSELMGDGTYQVRPGDQVVFHSGQLTAVDALGAGSCGCPAPPVPVMRAAVPDVPPIPEANLPSTLHLAQPGDENKPVPPPVSTEGLYAAGRAPSQVTVWVAPPPETAPLPAPEPGQVRVEIDAPLAFHASDLYAAPAVGPAPGTAGLPVSDRARPVLAAQVEPPPAAALTAPAAKPEAAPRRGFMGKVKGFFAALFR